MLLFLKGSATDFWAPSAVSGARSSGDTADEATRKGEMLRSKEAVCFIWPEVHILMKLIVKKIM